MVEGSLHADLSPFAADPVSAAAAEWNIPDNRSQG